MKTTTINISGMTCGHCVSAVTAELSTIAGVRGVDITLDRDGLSTATITSDAALDQREVSEAVAEAGYLVVADNA